MFSNCWVVRQCFLLVGLVMILFPVIGESATREILKAEQGGAVFSQCSRWTRKADRFFEPTEKEITQLEKSIDEVAKLESTHCCLMGKIKRPADYHRQYVGYVFEGRRLIYVHAYQGNVEHGIPVRICDGGKSSWGVTFDPATGRFFDLAINGLG